MGLQDKRAKGASKSSGPPVYLHREVFFLRAPDEAFARKLLSRVNIREGLIAELSPTEFLFAMGHLRPVRLRIEEMKLPVRVIGPGGLTRDAG